MSDPIVAYRLRQNLDHISELPSDPMDREFGEAEDYDAFIYKPNQAEEVGTGLIENAEPYEVPEPVDWVGFLDRLHQTDYLRNDLSWPLISKRMLYVLRSIEDFPHKIITTRIYDYGFQNQGRFNYKENTNSPAGDFK